MRAPVGAALTILALLGACGETRRSLGEDCLKAGDCLSGVCSQLQCSAAPQLRDGSSASPADAAPDPAMFSDASAAADSADARDAVDAAPDAAPADTGAGEAAADLDARSER